MRRKVNYEIFQFLNCLFDAHKRIAKKTRRDLIKGVITNAEFDKKRFAQETAFNRRYDAIYRKLA